MDLARPLDQPTRPTWSIDTLFKHSHDLLCVTDNASNLRRVNPAWSRAMGYAQTAQPGVPLFRLVDSADHDRLRTAFADAVVSGAPGWVEWLTALTLEKGLALVQRLAKESADAPA
jgi:PAS domain S-box-containing protein